MKRVGQYGTGFLSRLKRATGDVIAYRWHEEGRERKRVVGLASELKTEAAAWREVERLGLGTEGKSRNLEASGSALAGEGKQQTCLLHVGNDRRLHQELDYASLGFSVLE